MSFSIAIYHTKSKESSQSDYLPISGERERERERQTERQRERETVCVCLVPFSLHTYQVWFSLVSLFNGKSTMDVSGLQKNPELLPWGIFSRYNYILRDALV